MYVAYCLLSGEPSKQVSIWVTVAAVGADMLITAAVQTSEGGERCWEWKTRHILKVSHDQINAVFAIFFAMFLCLAPEAPLQTFNLLLNEH